MIYISNMYIYIYTVVGQASSGGMATRYRLQRMGIEFQQGIDFPHLSRPVLGPIQPPIKWVPRLLPWSKAAGAGWC